MAHYTIVVSPYWWGATWFLATLSSVLGVLAILTIFLTYQREKRRQSVIQEEQKQKATQALRSVQAQLNPHFIFNALTSIQGLVNRGDIDGANQYLSTFSVLMRNTLAHHDHLMSALDQELKSMEIYLSLEQLRFHFQFAIHTAPDLPVDSLEIPRLLLQPIIENAVRHGVSALRERGLVTVSVSAREKDLLIEVQDNGPGYSGPAPAESPAQGNYGLRLTADRIRLLNQLNPSTPIDLVHSGEDGKTTFTFIFNKWLA